METFRLLKITINDRITEPLELNCRYFKCWRVINEINGQWRAIFEENGRERRQQNVRT